MNNSDDDTGSIWRAIEFRCRCGHDRFVHEGSDAGDGFSCWWYGYCEKCKKVWEIDFETKVVKTDEYA